ncbi:MAG: CDP-alcohol phosphatidyltransferase family protein [Gemmatimonadetes bacterium]|nr:CDP-alcohol phosphatidyltransferase family protein [Gemmatimonadota bacterium]MBT8478685.1 CDP-alcohol phosphatidyltransferase family protein [Gemmatimonadota bacterium]NNK47517.1 CDP-diacylglycerol--glycerol-3-phosphate 3-phosphatidyltransferase [Gemmatimonadota bacterium]
MRDRVPNDVNLPNAITTLRVLLAPVVTVLLFESSASVRLIAFGVFLIAALSDLVDGALARRRGEITDFGKLVDPLADKLLLVATVIPFYLLTLRVPALGELPLFGGIGLWVLAVFFGRELLITWLRTAAARRGVIVPATTLGKRKALAQNVFIGSMILWLAYRTAVLEEGWTGPFNDFWAGLHGWFTSISLILALALTVVSLVVYVAAFSRVLGGNGD